MKVLALPRYERLGASSRMRFYQYLPALAAAGIAVELAPLFSDDYVRGLQQDRRSFMDVVRAYSRRMWPFRGRRQYDLLWIEKELLPWLPAKLEHAMLAGAVPYVLDYDDAVFHYYDHHRNPLVRRWLGRKHPTLMQGAALVLAGNDYGQQVETGAIDAGTGLVLLGDTGGGFKPVPACLSGFRADKDTRSLGLLHSASKRRLLLLGNNNDRLQVFEVKGAGNAGVGNALQR